MTEKSLPSVHLSILVDPIIECFNQLKNTFPDGGILIDATFGGGGHTREILKKLPENIVVLGLDKDLNAVQNGEINLNEFIKSGRLKIHHLTFGSFTPEVSNLLFPGKKVIGLLADLGFSSDQLENANRGISFLREGPLDMRLNLTTGKTAFETLQEMSETEIADLIFHYGEDRFARKIASSIFNAIKTKTLPNSTTAFANLIERAVPPKFRHTRIHAATRTFQALRIFVNDELEELDALLSRVIMNIESGGRVAIISFHSLEDRKVKQTLKNSDAWISLTKKPIEADEEELKFNPRSRSAKLRLGEKK